MGRKRRKIDTNSSVKGKKKRGNRSIVGNDDDDVDRISQLPDDILVDILSFLSMKEAGRTSVLSSRWINLWKHTPTLDFDADCNLGKMACLSKSKYENCISEYLKWVDSVIQLNKSPTLKQFKIFFPLEKSSSDSITQWLEFAFSRQVQRLELNLPQCNHFWGYYNFPEEFLAPRSSMPIFDFKSLRALCFINVSVSDVAIEYFLRNCPLLEQLIVDCPGKISKLEVCGPSLVLKHLEMVHCGYMESLKISAPTLTKLRVTSLERLLLENVPMLVDVSVKCQFHGHILKDLLSVLSCCISQLETLKLVLTTSVFTPQTGGIYLPEFFEMPKLKKLDIEYDWSDGWNPIRLASLTKASPCLQEFVLKNNWCERWHKFRQYDHDGGAAEAAAIIRFRHEHLKVFKFCGYHGRVCDDALVKYISENCVMLEKITIDPSAEYWYDGSSVEKAARKNAKQHLKPQLPRHVKLVVL